MKRGSATRTELDNDNPDTERCKDWDSSVTTCGSNTTVGYSPENSNEGLIQSFTIHSYMDFRKHIRFCRFGKIMKILEISRALFDVNEDHSEVSDTLVRNSLERSQLLPLHLCSFSLVLVRSDFSEAQKRSILLRMHQIGAKRPRKLYQGQVNELNKLPHLFFRTLDGYDLPEPRRLLAVALNAKITDNHLHTVFGNLNFQPRAEAKTRSTEWNAEIRNAMRGYVYFFFNICAFCFCLFQLCLCHDCRRRSANVEERYQQIFDVHHKFLWCCNESFVKAWWLQCLLFSYSVQQIVGLPAAVARIILFYTYC
jgi:hypothetical protein